MRVDLCCNKPHFYFILKGNESIDIKSILLIKIFSNLGEFQYYYALTSANLICYRCF